MSLLIRRRYTRSLLGGVFDWLIRARRRGRR
jgi:hypothetical protein